MNNINFFIFDFDGTLVNSMFIWENLGEFYLRSKNIQNIEYNISKIFSKMTFLQNVVYLKNKYLKNYTIQKIYLELYYYIETFYINFVYLKNGVKKFLYYNIDKHMCIASESNKQIIVNLLKKFDIYHFFDFIITPNDIGSTKKEIFMYKKCLEKFNSNIDNTILFEDALYAIKTANKIKLKTICILDQYSNQMNINNISYIKIINDFNELRKI